MSTDGAFQRGGKVPVTLVAGFFGSGKTTLLRHVIAQPGFEETALVFPDAGAVVVGDRILEVPEGDGQGMSAASDCPCCRDRSGVVHTLRALFRMRAEGAVPSFPRILVELDGLTTPQAVLEAILCDPETAARVILDGVVTLVDGESGGETLGRFPLAERQVAGADRLLISKTDLAGPAERHGLINRLRGLNHAAPMIKVAWGVVDLERVFSGRPAAMF